MSIYDGIDDYPESITEPDDSTPPDASMFNVPFESLADRTTYLRNKILPAPALSWFPSVAAPTDLQHAVFNSAWFESRWYAAKETATDTLYYSIDFGETWTADSRPASAIAIRDLAHDPTTGDMVLTSLGSVQIYDYDASAGTFTPHNALAGTPAGAIPMYAAVTIPLWCIVYRNATSGIGAATSQDRATWTDRTSALPVTFTGYTGTENPSAGVNSVGAIVALLNTGTGTDFKGAYSANGGVTWSAFTLATTLNTIATNPVWTDRDLGKWVVSIYDTAGEEVEVWSSSNGTTWTKVYNNTPGQFSWPTLAVLDDLFVTVGDGGQVYYSIDKGVTWYTAATAPIVGAIADLHIFSGGGGLLILEEGTPAAARSVREGLGAQV